MNYEVLKSAHLKDGLALLKLFLWFEKNISSKQLSELSISEKFQISFI